MYASAPPGPAPVGDSSKTRKADQLRALKRLVGEIEARRRQRDSYVFDRADGSVWNPDSFPWAFAELVRRKKLPKVRLHDLRHSHATIALAAGTDLKTISAALGHSTISVTANTYLHATEAAIQLNVDYEKRVRENIAPIVRDFEAAGRTVGTPPTFHLDFHADGNAMATEPTANASFILGSFPL